MRIKLDCDSCGHNFPVSDEYVGRRVRCPSCGEPVRVMEDERAGGSERHPRGSSPKSGTLKQRGSSQKSAGNGLAIGLGIGGGIAALGLIIAVALLLRPSAPPNVVDAQKPPVASPALPATTPNPTTPAPPSSQTNHQSTTPATIASAASNSPPQPAFSPPAAQSNPVPNPSEPSGENTEPIAPPTQAQAETPSPDTEPAKLSGVPEPSPSELKLPQLIQRVEPSVVRINVVAEHGASTGSGFVVSNDGTIVTNYHVVTSAQKADVQFADGTETKVIGYRHLVPKADIAIIKIDLPPAKLKPAPLAVKLPQKGESVAAFGAPLGLSFTASQGAITAIRQQKDLSGEMGLDLIGTWLQTDAAISPGNSGGPLSDHYGRIVGMNTMQLAVGQNLNFAVSALEIHQALRDAPSKVKPLRSADIPPYKKELARKVISEEIGTDRGRKLLSEVEEIFLVNVASIKNYDPTNAIWSRVIQRSQKAVEKSGIHLSLGEPAQDAALLSVYLIMNQSRKKTQGTQELRVRAELVCFDPLARKDESPLVMIWRDEQDIGTISMSAATIGKVPRTVDENLSKFFTGFRGAYTRAVREQKEAVAKAKTDSPTSAGK